MAKVEFRELYKVFGKDPRAGLDFIKNGGSREALLTEKQMTLSIDNLCLSVHENEFFVIMGLSGSGKSTLIRHINGLIKATDGQVLVNGKDVTQLREKELQQFRRYTVSMVFQKFGLLPHKTVLENIAFGLKIRGESVEEQRQKAKKWVERVGLAGYEDAYPRVLSGGMQQRVGLARALCVETEILLMDEPFSALDPLIRAEMQDVLLNLRKDMNKTILFVTHDLDEAVKLADRMAILKDGVVHQVGKPDDILQNPETEYVKSFVSKLHT